MKAKALRLPERLLHVVKFAEKRERLDEPTALRKFLWLGAEKYIAEIYDRGEISLREAASVLELTPRETLELFWNLGIRGNVGADMALEALRVAEKKTQYGR
ncbi:MAG: hypothetical protein A2X56_04800 [Nitrospirae bacterium GWC2_57_13]|jgi:hypothetical protein|nr:MAG: hypothetical protein A2X56_04800 [Nitrospirae bacterium GWC2_57_13]OGW43349.1 MAG: hypothetical protein A2X57_00015 [Nitrospirae bacterium GWD2_57_8]HAR46544.1 hypothetical protein [Nitrospiraceae bacterium]HAS54224.1 hypothetical protein [Nitrospiraceae bacterium]